MYVDVSPQRSSWSRRPSPRLCLEVSRKTDVTASLPVESREKNPCDHKDSPWNHVGLTGTNNLITFSAPPSQICMDVVPAFVHQMSLFAVRELSLSCVRLCQQLTLNVLSALLPDSFSYFFEHFSPLWVWVEFMQRKRFKYLNCGHLWGVIVASQKCSIRFFLYHFFLCKNLVELGGGTQQISQICNNHCIVCAFLNVLRPKRTHWKEGRGGKEIGERDVKWWRSESGSKSQPETCS